MNQYQLVERIVTAKLTPAEIAALAQHVDSMVANRNRPPANCENGKPDENILSERGWQ